MAQALACSVGQCSNTATRKGASLCEKHYRRFLAHGDPTKTLRPGLDMTPAERLARKTTKTAGCWLFETKSSYGKVSVGDGRTESAHRLAWELANGPIPAGLLVRHKCDVPRCVRPDHLELGTAADNSRDMTERRRQAFGEQQGSAKITATEVKAMRAAAQLGTTYRTLAARYGISESEVSAVVIGKKWQHVAGALPPRWKRLTPGERSEIVTLLATGMTQQEVASRYGVTRSAVSQMMHRNRKR